MLLLLASVVLEKDYSVDLMAGLQGGLYFFFHGCRVAVFQAKTRLSGVLVRRGCRSGDMTAGRPW